VLFVSRFMVDRFSGSSKAQISGPKEEIISPCVRLCSLNEGVCEGCGRTLEQIKNWRSLSHEERVAIIKTLNK
jgi:uncharacterized protein